MSAVPQGPYIRTGPETHETGGDGDGFAPYRKNPGMRVKLTRDAQLTKKGFLDREFVFPAPPTDTLARGLVADWQDYTTIGDGQYSRPNGVQLQTISFDTLLVENDYPWAFYNPLRTLGWDATEQSKQLGRLLRSMSPFRLTIEQGKLKAAGTAYDFGSVPIVTMLATLRSVTPTYKAGEPESVYVNVAFVEHRSPATTTKTLASSKSSSSGGAARGAAATVVKGGPNSLTVPVTIPLGQFAGSATTLHDLATNYYGSAAKWTVIKQANPWLGNVTADHNLGVWDTTELKTAGKANRSLAIPALT